ncbi:MAG TPA: hypothetical protein PLU50_04095, partial [Pseudobdellovibrionaceae bacterium]|nr:hypothetical protein [Pseudobdellovibrionaceae bacterium]
MTWMMENPAFKSLKTAPGAVIKAFYTVLLTFFVSSGSAWSSTDKPIPNQCQPALKAQQGSELGDSSASQSISSQPGSSAKARSEGLSVNFIKRITDRDGEWTAVVLLTEDGFRVQEATDWENAQRILEAAPLKYRKAFETLMLETSASFQV